MSFFFPFAANIEVVFDAVKDIIIMGVNGMDGGI
jgi:hypothetical protein